MTIQAQQMMYPSDNLAAGQYLQDWGTGAGTLNINNNDDDLGFNLSRQQKNELLQLQQQQYLLQLMNQRQQQQQLHEKQFLAPTVNNNGNNLALSSDTKNVFTAVTATTTPLTATTTPLNSVLLESPSCSGINKMTPTTTTTSLSQDVVALMESQKQEMDRFIDLQSQRLKLAIQEQRKHQLVTILRKLDQRAAVTFRMKDQQIARERKRAMELELSVRKVEEESENWRRIAGENEAMISHLSTAINQMRERQTGVIDDGVEDAESCCVGTNDDDDEICSQNNNNNNKRRRMETPTTATAPVAVAVSDNDHQHGAIGGDNDDGFFYDAAAAYSQKKSSSSSCRVCGCSGKLCVLFLPCRHLCSCKQCESFLEACPLCKSPKQATIEVLVS